MRISVFASKELQAVRAAAKELPRELASQLNKGTRAVAEPVWKREVAERVSTRLERRVIADTATVAVSRSNVTLKAGHRGKRMRGGATPPNIIAAVEFGADTNQRNTYQATSSKGRTFTVRNRRTRAQLRSRNPSGYVAYPAAAAVIPRIASLWVQTAMRTVYEAFEGK